MENDRSRKEYTMNYDLLKQIVFILYSLNAYVKLKKNSTICKQIS